MENNSERRERYSDGFSLTKYTMPVVWQMSKVIPGGFFIYHEDEKRELIYANQKVLDIYGCADLDEFKELTGYTFEGMVYHEDFVKIQSAIDSQIDAEDGDSMDHVQYRIVRKDGEIRWVDDFGHFSYSPEYGDVYYVFISDITESKKLAQSNHIHEELEKKISSLLTELEKPGNTLEPAAAGHIKELKELLENVSAK
ncbi:MAG: PAS domain-containing protein [Lachnospiraceae bacterium]|nr:PAS domain-containing protein [Lachnospiraceae bacterium]